MAAEENHTTASAVPANNSAASRADKKKKKKKKKALKPISNAEFTGASAAMSASSETTAAEDVAIEYVSKHEVNFEDPAFADFASVFAAFTPAEELIPSKKEETKATEKTASRSAQDTGANEDAEEEDPELSRKQRKKMKRLSIAELKQLVKKPDVVEQWDVTAADPRLLVHLKAYRNTVIVPKHWAQKRKYLQGKRGLEKPPFQLPDFIAATGIEKIRAAVQEKEDAKKLKAQARDKMAPRMGKIDIDYQVLHDAFFKYQTKPKLTGHGDVYYEGKEFEVKLKEKRPGQLSDDLKKALGIPEGGPPPWLINMQRYGPPPSYPNLKIPGLNAPIPDGAQYGYHPGGWGKPPVDEYGRPLYGDVFGTNRVEEVEEKVDIPAENLWGAMEEGDDDSDEYEDEDEDEDDQQSMADDETEAGISSISSVPSGMDTPESLELRKGHSTPASISGADTPDTSSSLDPRMQSQGSSKQLYQVLEQKESHVGSAAFGSAHVYAVPGKEKTAKKGGVDVTLNPTDLENLDEATLKAKYDEQLREEKRATEKEDVSDIIEENERRKRKKDGKGNEPKSKKYKDFKF